MPVRRVKIAFGISCDIVAAAGTAAGTGAGTGPAAPSGIGASISVASSTSGADDFNILFSPGTISWLALSGRRYPYTDLDRQSINTSANTGGTTDDRAGQIGRATSPLTRGRISGGPYNTT